MAGSTIKKSGIGIRQTIDSFPFTAPSDGIVEITVSAYGEVSLSAAVDNVGICWMRTTALQYGAHTMSFAVRKGNVVTLSGNTDTLFQSKFVPLT